MDFGFWISDFGFWILDFGFWILDFGSWILDFGFWILDFGFWILDFGSWILDFGFWILDQFSLRSFCGGPKRRRLDFGFWILDFGVWILDFGVWSLDFGFWILDFGFWILEFGFWILEFGFWILDFGLDEALPDIVWILHKIFPCHADSGRRIYRKLWRSPEQKRTLKTHPSGVSVFDIPRQNQDGWFVEKLMRSQELLIALGRRGQALWLGLPLVLRLQVAGILYG